MQVFADPYKATVTKEDGSEVEEDIYEAYNLGCVSAAVYVLLIRRSSRLAIAAPRSKDPLVPDRRRETL